MRLKFPYSSYRQYKVPIVPLELCHEDRWHRLFAFVDSGATYSLFHPDAAARLRLDYKGGKRTSVVVGDGNLITVFLHQLPMKIGSTVFPATVGFSSGLQVGFHLLGRQDVFHVFRVCFSDRWSEVTFTKV